MTGREKQIRKLQTELIAAVKDHNSIRIVMIEQQIKRLMYEQVSLQTAALESLTVDEHVRAVSLMNRVFVLGDLIEEAALDLEAYMRKTGVVKIGICEDARQIKRLAGKYAKLVDSYNDEGFSESFAELCDSIRYSVNNSFYKHEAALRPLIEKAHGSKPKREPCRGGKENG